MVNTFKVRKPMSNNDEHQEGRIIAHGIIFDSGRVVIEWLGKIQSIAVFGSVEELTMEINGSIKYIDSQQIGNLILLQREKTEERRKMYENWKEKRSSSKQQLLETQMMAINIVRQSHGLA